MSLEKNQNLAINIVNERIVTGDCYGHVLLKYVSTNYWDRYITENMQGIIVGNISNFNYSRCFHYMFIEQITSSPFFSDEANEKIIERGYVEFISLKISAIAPFFTIKKAMYTEERIPLDIIYLDALKNQMLEKKYQFLKRILSSEKLHEIDPEKLNKVLPNIKLENYEPEEVTYFRYLFE